MAQLAPQEVKGERGKVLGGRKLLEVSVVANGMKCRGKIFQSPHVPPFEIKY